LGSVCHWPGWAVLAGGAGAALTVI